MLFLGLFVKEAFVVGISRSALTMATNDGISGRDPRTLTEADFEAAGIESMPVLSAIRDKCIDCSGGSTAEVARCVAVSCALWPFRMNKNPFRVRKDESELTDAQREARFRSGERLRAMTARRMASRND
jgi:hypothetical protein